MAHDDAAREFDHPHSYGQRDPKQPADRRPEGGTDDGGETASPRERTDHPFEGKGMGDLNDSIVGSDE